MFNKMCITSHSIILRGQTIGTCAAKVCLRLGIKIGREFFFLYILNFKSSKHFSQYLKKVNIINKKLSLWIIINKTVLINLFGFLCFRVENIVQNLYMLMGTIDLYASFKNSRNYNIECKL